MLDIALAFIFSCALNLELKITEHHARNNRKISSDNDSILKKNFTSLENFLYNEDTNSKYYFSDAVAFACCNFFQAPNALFSFSSKLMQTSKLYTLVSSSAYSSLTLSALSWSTVLFTSASRLSLSFRLFSCTRLNSSLSFIALFASASFCLSWSRNFTQSASYTITKIINHQSFLKTSTA